jgi:hypothetical protein
MMVKCTTFISVAIIRSPINSALEHNDLRKLGSGEGLVKEERMESLQSHALISRLLKSPSLVSRHRTEARDVQEFGWARRRGDLRRRKRRRRVGFAFG